MKTNWENTMNEIIELDEDVVVVIGTGDIISKRHQYFITVNSFKEITADSFYRIIGRGTDDVIIDALMNYPCDIDDKPQPEGEYEFKAILRHIKEDFGLSYLEVEHITFKFIQTFAQRKREFILNDLMTSNTKSDDFPF